MPEVEQVRKSLAPYIKGKKIKQVDVMLPRLIQSMSVNRFTKAVTGQKINQISRRGKYLVLHLDKGFIVVHLRMTGALLTVDKKMIPDYAKVHFVLDGDRDMWFTDIRAFGTIYFVEDPLEIKGYATLGPEPLSKELSVKYLQPYIEKAKKPVKTFILDQTIIAGLGNIYADECLFLAGVAPLRLACTLTKAEINKLIKSINKVIEQGIKNHGTTFRDYKDGEGNKGNNQNYLNVYSRGGKPCKKCGKILCKIKIGGRGTVYCEHCQK